MLSARYFVETEQNRAKCGIVGGQTKKDQVGEWA